MLISDLNTLETVKGNEVVGGFRNRNVKEVLERDVKTTLKNKTTSDVDLRGNAANAQADADALGRNTLTDTFTTTTVVQGKGSSSTSGSSSATVGFKKGY